MASVADCAQDAFITYYDHVMPPLSQILMGAQVRRHAARRNAPPPERWGGGQPTCSPWPCFAAAGQPFSRHACAPALDLKQSAGWPPEVCSCAWRVVWWRAGQAAPPAARQGAGVHQPGGHGGGQGALQGRRAARHGPHAAAAGTGAGAGRGPRGRRAWLAGLHLVKPCPLGTAQRGMERGVPGQPTPAAAVALVHTCRRMPGRLTWACDRAPCVR